MLTGRNLNWPEPRLGRITADLKVTDLKVTGQSLTSLRQHKRKDCSKSVGRVFLP